MKLGRHRRTNLLAWKGSSWRPGRSAKGFSTPKQADNPTEGFDPNAESGFSIWNNTLNGSDLVEVTVLSTAIRIIGA
jgi:hypothetical protein